MLIISLKRTILSPRLSLTPVSSLSLSLCYCGTQSEKHTTGRQIFLWRFSPYLSSCATIILWLCMNAVSLLCQFSLSSFSPFCTDAYSGRDGNYLSPNKPLKKAKPLKRQESGHHLQNTLADKRWSIQDKRFWDVALRSRSFWQMRPALWNRKWR